MSTQPAQGQPASPPVEIGAALACRVTETAQRVLCALRVQAPAGYQMSWVDALILSTPDFARALRSRVRARNAKSSVAVELPLALVASAPGSGLVGVRARAVVCPTEGGGRCLPVTREVQAELVVHERSKP